MNHQLNLSFSQELPPAMYPSQLSKDPNKVIFLPPPLTGHNDVYDWYKTLKTEYCDCVACQKTNPEAKTHESFAELHHISRETKCATVYQLVRHRSHSGIVLDETLKTVPLCSNHHKHYHYLEDKSPKDCLSLYDFNNDTFYKEKVKEFHANAIEIAPPSMLKDLETYRSSTAYGTHTALRR